MMKYYEKNLKTKKTEYREGITLIALVITIIILLILASVAIQLAFGEQGLIKKSKDGEKLNTYAELIERSKAEIASISIGKVIDGDTSFSFNEVYSLPFFVNNYDIVGNDIVKKGKTEPIISKIDYEELLKPSNVSGAGSTPSTPSTPTTPVLPPTPTVPVSSAPQMYVISNKERFVAGKGIVGSNITVTMPDGTDKTTTVNTSGEWSVFTGYLAIGDVVKVKQQENGKDYSSEVIQTVAQARNVTVGSNQLKFNIKTTVPVRVFMVFKGAGAGTTMNPLGGSLSVAGGVGIYHGGEFYFIGAGNGTDYNVGVSGGLYRITVQPINAGDTITSETTQLTITDFGDIQGDIELENVTSVQGTPTSSTNTGKVTIKYLNGPVKVYDLNS